MILFWLYINTPKNTVYRIFRIFWFDQNKSRIAKFGRFRQVQVTFDQLLTDLARIGSRRISLGRD